MDADELREYQMGFLGLFLSEETDPSRLKSVQLDYFTDEECRKLYAALCDVYEDTGKLQFDEKMLAASKANAGVYFFNLCSEQTVNVIGTHPEIILASEYLKRRIVQEVANVRDMYDGADQLFALTEELEKLKSGMFQSSEHATHERFEAKLESDRALIKSGIPILDSFIGGFALGELVVIAGRPSTGKTAYACTLAYNIAHRGYAVDVFSLEMEADSWRRRIVARMSNVPIWKMRNHTKSNPVLTPEEYDAAISASRILDREPLRVFTTSGMNIGNVVNRIASSPADVVVIDYLGLIVPTVRGNLNEKTKEISNALANASRRHMKSILLLAQLNRDSEREKRAPQLTDLRDSGEIEQDADAVQFVHEPERAENRRANSKIVTSEIHIAKMRDGNTGIASVRHARDISHFYEHVEMPEIQYSQTQVPF